MKHFLRFSEIESFGTMTIYQMEYFMASVKIDAMGDQINYYEDMFERAQQLGVEVKIGEQSTSERI